MPSANRLPGAKGFKVKVGGRLQNILGGHWIAFSGCLGGNYRKDSLGVLLL